jgi:hypothetical protein
MQLVTHARRTQHQDHAQYPPPSFPLAKAHSQLSGPRLTTCGRGHCKHTAHSTCLDSTASQHRTSPSLLHQPRRTQTTGWLIAKTPVVGALCSARMQLVVQTRTNTASEQRKYPHPPSLRPRRTQATEWPPPDNCWEEALQTHSSQHTYGQPSMTAAHIPIPPSSAKAHPNWMAHS